MFLLAASLAVATKCGGLQAARTLSREESAWNMIRPAIVTLYGNGRPTGVAALVDDSGYFVASDSSTVGSQLVGITSAGKQVVFKVVSRDSASMLVLLKTDDWQSGSARPFHSPMTGEETGSSLIGVVPTGPIHMAYGSRHKLGVLNPSRRLVPLTEMRFEASAQAVGGALIFSIDGDLMGSLNATLVRQDSALRNNTPNIVNNTANNTANAERLRQQYMNTGPSQMTVAYAVSPEFVKHVLDGFLSPSHAVEYAILGVFCKDSVGGGAQIEAVTPGSPADIVGLRQGDVLLNIASNAIPDQVAFAAVMLLQKPDKKIPILIERGGNKILMDIVPAKAAD